MKNNMNNMKRHVAHYSSVGHFLLMAFLLLSHNCLEAQKVRFAQWLDNNTLRIDCLRTGNRAGDTVRVVSYEQIPVWPGSTTQLMDPFDNGAYRVTLIDSASGTRLYSRCYSTLFHEYRDTPEGAKVSRTFEEVVRVPWPKKSAMVLFERRGDDNILHPQDTFLFNPQLIRSSVVKSYVDPLRLHHNGNPHKKIDVVIVPEGYGPADTAKMRRDLKTFCEYLLAQEPFRSRRKDFNVWGILLSGKESGITDPNKGIKVESLVGASFNTFGSDRYLMTERLFQLHNSIGLTPCDHIIIMANSTTYGGGAIYNFYAMSSMNEMAHMVLPHELGHSIGGLADEYVDEELSYGDIHSPGMEPTEPNITTMVHFEDKWQSMLNPETPIPTPVDASVPRNVNGLIGVYEGAGYRAKGIYRPAMHCMMRDYAPFCPVCSKRLNAIFDLYTK